MHLKLLQLFLLSEIPCYHGAYSSFCISLCRLFASYTVWRRCEPRQLREWKRIKETGKCVDRRMELTAVPEESLCYILWFGQSERTVFTWANNWTFVRSSDGRVVSYKLTIQNQRIDLSLFYGRRFLSMKDERRFLWYNTIRVNYLIVSVIDVNGPYRWSEWTK